MDVVVAILLASILIGFATGLIFRSGLFAIELASILIALGAAAILQFFEFEFWSGAIVIAASLFVSQLAYLLSPFLRPSFAKSFAVGLMSQNADNEPRDGAQGTVHDDKVKQKESPRDPSSPPEY